MAEEERRNKGKITKHTKKEKISFVSLFFLCFVVSLLPPISQTTVNGRATQISAVVFFPISS
jgi:VanZ family protein